MKVVENRSSRDGVEWIWWNSYNIFLCTPKKSRQISVINVNGDFKKYVVKALIVYKVSLIEGWKSFPLRQEESTIKLGAVKNLMGRRIFLNEKGINVSKEKHIFCEISLLLLLPPLLFRKVTYRFQQIKWEQIRSMRRERKKVE
jgi:hypothetical protein